MPIRNRVEEVLLVGKSIHSIKCISANQNEWLMGLEIRHHKSYSGYIHWSAKEVWGKSDVKVDITEVRHSLTISSLNFKKVIQWFQMMTGQMGFVE